MYEGKRPCTQKQADKGEVDDQDQIGGETVEPFTTSLLLSAYRISSTAR
jgi:hypothetical protein